LEVQGLDKSATVFNGRHLLYVEAKTFSIFIQTNKAIYRPGDLVQYRVLVLDPDTKPIKVEKSLHVSVYDANANLILMNNNQSALQGVYRGEFRVGEADKIGMWTIEANFKDQQIRKTIEIAEYMSERFQVTVSVPVFISKNSTQFLISIDSKYTFGKPVRGIVTTKITPVFQAAGAWPELGEPVSITDVINGRYLVGFNMADFGESDLTDYNAILVQVSVQEKITGITVKSRDKTVLIDEHKSHTKYSISVTSFKFYLPGTEYLLAIQVDAKNGRPLSVKSRKLAIEILYLSEEFEEVLTQSATLDGKGRTDVIIDVPAKKLTHIKFRIRYLNALEEVTILAKPLHVQVTSEK
jgi:CD109 antigen